MLDNGTQNMRIRVIGNEDRHGYREAYKDSGTYVALAQRRRLCGTPMWHFYVLQAPLVIVIKSGLATPGKPAACVVTDEDAWITMLPTHHSYSLQS